MNDNINLIKIKNTITKLLNQEFGNSFDFENKYNEFLKNSDHYIKLITEELIENSVSFKKEDIEYNYNIILELVKEEQRDNVNKRKNELFEALYNKIKELIKNNEFEKFKKSSNEDDYKYGVISSLSDNLEENNYLFSIWNEAYQKAVDDSSSVIMRQEMDKKFEQLQEEKKIKASKRAIEQNIYKEEKIIKHKGLFLLGAAGFGFLKGLYNASGHGKKKR